MNLPTTKEGALDIVRTLHAAGKRALLAGGCVRDLVLGVEPKDYDIATDATPQEVARLFDKTIPVGIEFGIIAVLLKGEQYQVARFRTEGPYRDGRHPESVAFAEPEEDARRRDFTINGMFFDVEADRVIDHVGGRGDLEAGVVRAIGDPLARFGEDYLRMLRAVRFAARLEFEIEPATYKAIVATAPQIRRTSAERVRDELTLILTEGSASRGMALLMETGLLAQLMPEVAAMDGVAQAPEHHPEGDVWTHVKLMLERLDKGMSGTLAWGVLLHDIGKPPTYSESDRIRFHGHDAVGAKRRRTSADACTCQTTRSNGSAASPPIICVFATSKR
jgi:poly(A) polymerase